MAELDDAIHDEIRALCEEGDELAEEEQYAEALERYGEAWELIPEPKTGWGASTWVLAAIGDACFFLGEWAEAQKALAFAMTCPDGLGNPFLHLRLGQCAFELGDLDRAADELMRAYMGDGADVFASDDPKYLAFLGTRAKLG